MISPKSIQDVKIDGNGTLTAAEALAALRLADEAAKAAKRDALRLCETQEERCKVLSDCIDCSLAYTSALQKSLKLTGPLFEQTAKELREAANEVTKKSKQLTRAADAVKLLTQAVKLAKSLSGAFA
ncbi:hypothetical protein [Candidatus Electronema sp. PJ]|uniref:hypothetical protein n=1 Tax=Candidatus Electronema sp. PJ TaxID=3401572 RepID=UPI003AA7FC74